MDKIKIHENISLYQWIWQSYIRTALIPLILVELIFVCIYFSSNAWSQKKAVDSLKQQAQIELAQNVKHDADSIDYQLANITNSAMLFSNQMGHALSTPTSLAPVNDNRLTYYKDRIYYTKKDNGDGGASIFYSGILPIKEDQQQKVVKVSTQQSLMEDIKNTQPLATSIYFNTFDSLNVTYPYFDVISKYDLLLDIPSHNFYYEADTEHNPEKRVIWTDAYLDPAGHGLITSAICPVYINNFLEGVVGINVTISNLTNQISAMHVPWEGYLLLIEKNGNFLSLPNMGANDLGLNELTENSYNQATFKDKLNQDEFNLYKNKELISLANEVTNNADGISSFTLKGKPRIVSWSTISTTGCKLIEIIPEQNIYSEVYVLKANLVQIAIVMILGLILSYLIFFLILYKKVRKMNDNIANSLLEINSIVESISHGKYNQKEPMLNIKEFKDISVHLIKMGQNLGETNKNLLLTQSELRKKEIDLKALVNSINDIILEIDSKGAITNFWSRTHHDLFKLYMQGCFNSIDDFLDTNTSKIARKKIIYVIRTKETVYMNYTIESNSGLKWFQACISPRLNDTSKVVVSARDITVQKKMERSLIAAKEEAEKASKAKSQFLSSMSHELRTPLNAILGFSQVLELDPESPLTDSQHESVAEILKAGNHLLELINEVLDLAKIESGKMSISIESVPIKSVIEETLAIIKPFAHNHEIKLITHPIENSNEFVFADNTRLKQILLNLLSNAIKYNKPNGQVTFYHDRINDKCIFHVIDTGIGVSDSDLNLIFKPFQRLNKLNNAIEGTGIGLTVAKQLVELMNGEIHVDSEKGVGSHFWVELPYIDSSNSQNFKNSISIGSQSFFSKEILYKVLYVEDNSANLRLVQRILSQIENIYMLSTTSGELCIDLAIAHKPDIILLDINLPGIDGYEVFKRLKMCEETNNIPIIAISAHAMPRDIEKGLLIGFTDYITKPINVQSFTEKISNILLNNEPKDEP